MPQVITDIKTEIYFGLSNAEGEITEETWDKFKQEKIEKIFSGYTEVDADGFWRNSEGQKFRERSKLLIYIHSNSEAENQKIDSVINLYKSEFNQESVLRIDQEIKIFWNDN